ncbi:MAG: outer membrane protein assembly factor BamB [Rhodothermales bacterium]|jgi:outer membrane protein assembly factor BamB
MKRSTMHIMNTVSRRAGLACILLISVLVSGCDIFGDAIDERAPTVQVDRPFDGATLSGANVMVAVNASALGDGNFISFVNVNLDGVRIDEAEWDGTRYVTRINSFELSDGLHRLEAVAFDSFQARGVSAPITLLVENISLGDGPVMQVLEPEANRTVSGVVRVLAQTASGQPPVTRVDLLVDGIPFYTTTTSIGGDAYAFDWDTSQFGAGDHVLEIKSFSGPGVFRLNEPRSVSVEGGGGDPVDSEGPGALAFRGTGLAGEVKGSAAVGFNDDIYLGSSNGTLYAFDNEGMLRWERDTKGPIRSTPVVGNNEDVFVTSEDGRLWGFTADGRDLWAVPYNSAAPLRSAPAMGVDGVLYFGDTFGNLHAVNSFNGLSAWSSPIKVSNGSIVQAPVITRDHTVVVADSEGRLSGFDRNGGLLWQSAIRGSGSCGGGTSRAPMALAEIQLTVELPTGEIRSSTEALVYVMADDGCLYAFSGFDGSRLWHYSLGGSTLAGPTLVSGPVVDEGGTIYVGTETGLFALNETADALTPRLRYKFVADDVGMPAIDTNGVIHFVAGRNVMAINTNGTPYWEYQLNSESDGPVTINREGVLIVPARNGHLFGFQTGSAGLARGKWPMFGRNARHTNRLGIDANDG